MIEQFRTALRNSREHWLFWPLAFLLLLGVGYNFLFSESGYLVYMEKERVKKELILEIEQLKGKKETLLKNLENLRNDETAFPIFSKEHFLYDNSVTILKFYDEKDPSPELAEQGLDIERLRKIYIVAASFILLGATFVFWQWHSAPERETNDA